MNCKNYYVGKILRYNPGKYSSGIISDKIRYMLIIKEYANALIALNISSVADKPKSITSLRNVLLNKTNLLPRKSFVKTNDVYIIEKFDGLAWFLINPFNKISDEDFKKVIFRYRMEYANFLKRGLFEKDKFFKIETIDRETFLKQPDNIYPTIFKRK